MVTGIAMLVVKCSTIWNMGKAKEKFFYEVFTFSSTKSFIMLSLLELSVIIQ